MSNSTEVPPIAVVLDVDGVIAPIRGATAWGDDIILGDPEAGLRISPSMCAELDKLTMHGQAACYWLTDWSETMRHDYEQFPGHDWPGIVDDPIEGHFRAEEWAAEWWPVLPWWKWWALEEWLGQHPEVRRLIWVDDHLSKHTSNSNADDSPTRRAWTIETALRHGALVDPLLLSPDKHTGLRPLDLRIINDWILGVR